MVSNKMDISFVPMTIPDDVSEMVVEITAIVSSTEYVANLAATNWVNLAAHPVVSLL